MHYKKLSLIVFFALGFSKCYGAELFFDVGSLDSCLELFAELDRQQQQQALQQQLLAQGAMSHQEATDQQRAHDDRDRRSKRRESVDDDHDDQQPPHKKIRYEGDISPEEALKRAGHDINTVLISSAESGSKRWGCNVPACNGSCAWQLGQLGDEGKNKKHNVQEHVLRVCEAKRFQCPGCLGWYAQRRNHTSAYIRNYVIALKKSIIFTATMNR